MVIRRPHILSRPRRHPRPAVFSDYLNGDLDADDRRALECHVRDCARCRQLLASLATTVRALGSLRDVRPAGLADSVIAALRAEHPETALHERSQPADRMPALAIVRERGAGDRIRTRWPREARAALGWCLQRPQLRLTLPITLVAGALLSIVNMGGMLMHGKIDLGVCLSCAVDFLVPFVGVNVGLLAVLRLPRRPRL